MRGAAMRLRRTLCGLVILNVLGIGFMGCSGAPPGTDLPTEKPLSKEEFEAQTRKVMEGMKGNYKGAPGAPTPKS
jgi:hypothetical protein